MNKRQITIIIIAILAVVATAIGTVAALNYFDGKEKTTTTTVGNSDKKAEEEPIKEFTETIDEDKNNQAKTIEESAMSLMESDPSAARKKYLEAEKAYKEAGNMGKVGEMRANALSAQAEIDARKTAN